MLYELLAGRRPNAGENAMNTLAKAIEGFSFPNVRELRPDVPSALAKLVSDMTLPDPDDRPASASLVLMRIVQLVDTSEDDAPGAAVPQVKLPWYRDRGVLYAATAMALAIEALVLAVFRALRGG